MFLKVFSKFSIKCTCKICPIENVNGNMIPEFLKMSVEDLLKIASIATKEVRVQFEKEMKLGYF